MPRVRVFHWKESEAQPLIDVLEAAGYTVDYPGEKVNGRIHEMRTKPPVAAVIDMTRMPSHGRYMGIWLRRTKYTRHIPIVFVDGAPEKVELVRKELPDAIYTTRGRLVSALKRLKPVTAPVVPGQPLAGYTKRTTAQKLGIKDGMRVAVMNAPRGYAKAIGTLPKGASLEEEPEEILPITLWFVEDAEAYLAGLEAMRERTGKSRLWVIYPKAQAKSKARTRRGSGARNSPGVTQFFIRQSALEVGLVDYKICSIDEIWTGMLFTIKK